MPNWTMPVERYSAPRGFTLVELLVVIAILGSLSAVALPRLSDLRTQARKAKANAMLGAVRAAAANAKAAALVASVSCSNATGSVAMEGTSVTLNYCYPTADAAGIIAAANLSTTNDTVTIGTGAATAGSTITITVNGAADTTKCQVSYTSPNGTIFVPTIAFVDANLSGC
jgi:MSHA pilin protein MshA